MERQQIGLVGLGVMGANLALNIEEKGFSVAVYNRSPDKTEAFLSEAAGKRIVGHSSLEALCAGLERPRRIVLMIKAGRPVDDTIAALRPFLDRDDLIVDGGNEFFQNTIRRGEALAAVGLQFVGMGVSGGEEGARHGPSLMPGGPRAAYELLAPILTRVAAQVDDGPCVDYMGPGGAGHYVKMVHNGIEYGDMQLIAEAYDLLQHLGGLAAEELAEVFEAWNGGELESFLIEITGKIFRQRDELTGRPLVDLILDASGMKGTGQWTVQEAAGLGAPVPTIASAVEARVISARKLERVAASRLLSGPQPAPAGATGIDRTQLVDDVRRALYAAKICSYAQGMNLLKTASAAHGWDLQLGRIARIWKGGCIIRARFLDDIKQAYARSPELASLLVDPEFARALGERQEAWRRVISLGIGRGIPLPAMTSSLAYYDSSRRERLPANLIQAQRDFFGAHTYRRIDRDGVFHTEWSA